MILAFNKPYGVLSQFTREAPHHRTLAEFGFPSGVYPVGRLDADSEGLLLLSDEKTLVDRLLNPANRHPRTYWSQVEGIPSAADLLPLERGGLSIRGYRTLPCRVSLMNREPDVPPRNPPVRYRAAIPTSWLELTLVEGKNRQVRRMTAAIGFPTLRLLRAGIGGFPLDGLEPGSWKELTPRERRELMP
ncbi:pseudouridine synthase [Akkermansia muciniphila]|uniref:Pseudouridine synthase n=1 Tax=Akkermansia muciniphila TaxID=239935 RepID=A0A2N8HCS4_9BACT|nr:pseudouridine synthase [Akkermansia muciniphila]PNC17664.1 pseudouridine synthase [Akkermansia muciniphila]